MSFRSPLVSMVLSVAFLVMFATVPALADGIHSPGPPVDGNSWSTPLTFTNGTGIPFDTVESFIIFDTGAGPFDGIGKRNFRDDGATWTATTPNPNYTIASGPPIPNGLLTWDYHFLGDFEGNTLSIDFLAWSEGVGSVLMFAATFDYIDGVFDNLEQSFGGPYDFLQDPTGGDGYDRSVIPEPSSTAILGVCLIGAWMRRRR